MQNELTPEMQLDLSVHRYAMDSETAAILYKVSGIAVLIRNATGDLGVNEPMPDGVAEAFWAIEDMIAGALKRAGC